MIQFIPNISNREIYIGKEHISGCHGLKVQVG